MPPLTMEGFEDIKLESPKRDPVQEALSVQVLLQYAIHGADNSYRDDGFTMVDPETPHHSRLMAFIVGSEKRRFTLPRTLSCTVSPVFAKMMQDAVAKNTKKWTGWEHVSHLRDGSTDSEAHNDAHKLDFASHGQARLRQPTFDLPNASPAAFQALTRWISHPVACISSDNVLCSMVFQPKVLHYHCLCFVLDHRSPGKLTSANYCTKHDPTVAINLIRLATDFKITKLQYAATKALLLASGIIDVVENQVDVSEYPNSITFQRAVAHKAANALQFFRLTVTNKAADNMDYELSGEEYEISGVREGEFAGVDGDGCVRQMCAYGSFEVYFD